MRSRVFGVRSTGGTGTPRGWLGGLSCLLVLALTALGASAVEAQTGQITGTVTNASTGGPLGEVQVYIVDQQLGSLSRADGRFLILNVPAGTYELRAERIGYAAATQSVSVTAGGTATANFALETQALGLDEIVVTGTAGAARRREVGNSIAQINVADVQGEPVSVTNLLQGAAPGVDILGGSAEAGQGKKIRLRGNSSVSMTNQPIIYIDGIRMRSEPLPIVNSMDTGSGRGARVSASPLDNINPNDIARIEIIKGSAATTLFGTEASAGVIQIFTKRGSTGAPIWTAEIQQGTQWVQPFGLNGVNYLNMEHYMRDAWWGGGYEGGDGSDPCVTDDPRWEGVNSSAEGACSWPGAAWLQNYSLSVRGGGQDLQYFLSGQYQDDAYVLPNDYLEKYNFRGNFTITPIDNLQIQWNTGYTNQWQQNTSTANNAQGVTLNAFRQERNYFATRDPRRIATTLEYDIQQTIERLTTGITLTYNPLANLTQRFTVGYDFTQQEGRNLRNFGFEQYPQGSITNDTWQNRLLTFDYVGTYSFGLTDAVNSAFSWGGQAIGDEDRRVRAYGEDFPGAAYPTVGSAALTFADEDREKIWNAGFFFQNVFDISNKYFITAGVRVDGNSAFGTGFGLQVYPKVSGSWVASDEAFWPASAGTMKLRAAYGQSGRAPGAFDAIRTWSPAGFAGNPAFTPSNLGNPDLGPEVTAEWEVGFDAAWFEDRLSATFTYYSQVTNDALMEVTQVPSLGFTSSQLQNVGKLGNKGIELQVNGSPIVGADWGLDLGLAVSTNYSKVLDIGGIPQFGALGGEIIQGHSVPVNYDLRVENPNGTDGDWDYVDGGTDQIIGPQLPTHFINPSLTVRVPGNITVSARGEYRGGNMMEVNPIAVGRSVRSPLCFPWYVDPTGGLDLKAETPNIWRERCSPTGTEDYWMDADYFKLRSLSATIPVGFAFPDRISGAVLTMSLDNAWDWYREIPWYDAEIPSNAAATSDAIGDATERLPGPASFRISLRVTF